jgi:hypothetical protein
MNVLMIPAPIPFLLIPGMRWVRIVVLWQLPIAGQPRSLRIHQLYAVA